ncbi:DUF6443 domain-containing protein [Chryseobacterium gambrini]|uniref:DUF6443 domain-containing protein n=1 Tax=Chryseobacterium gambrini TaxID=373672 RepID=UPI0025B2BA9E|nr:DUF6443 domain-containing protein [Chryseobacterium gambrini]MDN4031598.1 DUF6443 domain-containing protein [Chryseobacterium gambrini]
MKKSFNIFSLLFVAGLSYAQTTGLSTDQNFIYTKNCLNEDCSRKTEAVQYSDGLGRAKQVISIKASPNGKDIVIPSEYDSFGRQLRSYLPVPQTGTQNGAIYTDPKANAAQAYGSDPYFYSESVQENAPGGKLLSQRKPGSDYLGHSVQYGYGVNAADEVKKYTVTTSWLNGATSNVVTPAGNYGAGELMKTSVTDEDGHQTTEYKNGKGQTVLVKKQNTETYYLYNKYGQLAYVIPPLAASQPLTGTVLDELCYQYRYDSRSRQVEKKLPGKGWEYIVYDTQDRVLMTQDANMGASRQWLFTKYDRFGRTVYTGIFTSAQNYGSEGRQAEQNTANAAAVSQNESRNPGGFSANGVTAYYTNSAYPTAFTRILSINYFDTYPAETPARPSQVFGKNTIGDNLAMAVNTKNLPTASYVKNIEDDNWTKSYIWYDEKARAIGSHSVNHLGGYTKTESELDFSGTPQKTKVYHKRLSSDTETIITQIYEYDSQNRLKKQWHQVNSQPQELLSENTYNELSQLSNKKVGNNLQNIDYAYNIRGWMTRINDPSGLNGKLFGYEVKYTDPLNTSASAKYNGNITEVNWKTSTDGVYRRYNYTYDALNRLLQGTYSEPYNSVTSNNYFNENISYDSNGNIKTLKRFSRPSSGTIAEKIDDLVYNYENSNLSNRLASISLPAGVANNASGYNALGYTIGYDANGNMTSQQDKGISAIQYNLLNLASVMTTAQGTISYTYAADGTKLRKAATSKTVDYLDGFQYETSQSTTSLQFIPTAEGYFDFVKNKYIYSYKDHLGNVRLSYFRNTNGSAEVLEENNYYPFGLKHEGYNALAGNNSYQYKYNGKELQETKMLDYGWRQYMPELGRWNGMDQLAETYNSVSPFAYVGNNPIDMFDPDGRLTQAQTDYIWNNSGQGVTSWSFNNDGSPKLNSFNYMNDSDSQSLIKSFYAAASGEGSSTIHYWTGNSTATAYTSNNELFGDHNFGTLHQLTIKIENGTPFDAYKNWADWGSTTLGGGFKYISEQRTALYNSGYWIDNLGQMRSITYAGRGRGSSLIGLRSDYLRNTVMLGKYAKRAGYVGYAISAAQISYGVYKDGGKFGVRAQVATANVAGGMAGAAVGAWLGAKILAPIGGAIGVAFFGVGAAPGAAIGGAIGGIVGGILGGVYGGDYAEGVASRILNKPDY